MGVYPGCMNNLLESLLWGEKAVRSVGDTAAVYGVESGARRRISTGRTADFMGAYGGKDAIDWAMDCADLWAQTTSNADYHFEKDGKYLTTEKKPGDPEDWGEAPLDLVNLFRRPNPFMDYTELMELSVIDILFAGEMFWLKFKPADESGKPLGLYRLSPALVDIELDDKFIGKYIYNPPDGKPMEIDPAHMLHIKRPNPHDPFRGLSVVAGGPQVWDTELALTESSMTYYQQGTKLAGVLESDRSVPQAIINKLKAQWSSLYAGGRNAGKVAVLERGLRFNSISATAAEAQYKEMMTWSRDRIFAAFKVPPPLIGFVGSADRQAVKEAQRIFDNKVVRPFLNRLQSQISHGLCDAWGVDFIIDHKYEMPIEDRLDLATGAAAIPGIRVREIRELAGYEPLGDPEIDDLVLNLPGQERDEGGFPDENLPGEAGRPPNAENKKPFPKPGQKLPAGAAATRAQASLQRGREALKRAGATVRS